MVFMSNNQWKCDQNSENWIAMGEDCSAEVRVIGLVRAYKEVLPDILGLQEVSLHMAELMMEQMCKIELPDGTFAKYEYVSGGDTPIVFRRDKFLLIESGFFRYSEEVPGLGGSFNNYGTKSYCFGVFEEIATKKRFALMSTHLWWRQESSCPGSDEARAYQISLASQRMDEIAEKYHCPCVLMGDFNASMNSLCFETAQKMGWKDVHDLAVGDRDETRGCHFCGGQGFRRDEPGKFAQAIDHIMVKNAENVTVKHFRRLTHEWFDKISDHYPLYVEIEI